MKKRMAAIVLCVLMLFGTAPAMGLGMLVSAANHSGVCGDNVAWTLNTGTGEIMIQGIGAMNDYGYNTAPWQSYKSYIESVVVSDGVTSVGGCAFYGCANLQTIDFSETVTKIGNHAFYSCSTIESIFVPSNIKEIGKSAFGECIALWDATIEPGIKTLEDGVFSGCAALTEFTVPYGVKNICEARRNANNY